MVPDTWLLRPHDQAVTITITVVTIHVRTAVIIVKMSMSSPGFPTDIAS